MTNEKAKKRKQLTKRQQQRLAALIDFVNMCEVPFTDLRPYLGDSENMTEYRNVQSIIRRLEMAERAGLKPKQGTPERRIFDCLKEELEADERRLRETVRSERITRAIAMGMLS